MLCKPFTRGQTTIRTADGGFRVVRLARMVEIPRVPPGSEGVVITLAEHVDTNAKVDRRVTTEGGAAPPPLVHYELRHLGPNGSVFFQQSEMGKPDASGLIPIRDLLPGARYEVGIRERYFLEDPCSGPFVAQLGTQQIHLVLPFCVEVEIEVRDAEGRPAQSVGLQVFTPTEPGKRHRTIFFRGGLSNWPVRFPVVPGTYRVDAVGGRNARATGELVVGELPVRLVLDLSR